MPLSRYSVEVNGIAESFAEIIQNHYEDAAYRLANEKGQKLLAMTSEEYDKALKFLSQTPSEHDKALNKLSDDDAAILLMRARYLGLIAAQAIGLADDFQFIPGKGYRQAAAYAVNETCEHA